MAAGQLGRRREARRAESSDADAARRPVAPLIGSSARYRASFMSSADAWIIVGQNDGRLVDVNDRFLAMYGYRREEVIGRTSLELGLWGDPADRSRLLQELDRTGFVRAFPVVGVRKGGERFHVQYSVTRIKGAGPTPLLLGGIRDVTAEYEAREAMRQSDAVLRTSEDRLRTLVAEADVAIGMSRDGKTVWANESYLRMFGFDRDDELIGHELVEQIAPQDRAMVHDRALRRERGEAVVNTYEAMFQRRDGSTFPGRCAVSRVHLAEGPANMVFISDLTELRQAEADLDLERSITGALHDALHALPEGWSAEQSATALCAALVELPAISLAAILAFGPEGRLDPLGYACVDPVTVIPTGQPSPRLRRVIGQIATGPFAEWWEPLRDDGPLATALTELGVRAAAFGPIEHGDHADGILVIATTDETFARTLVERIPTAVDFTSTPTALLAERLHTWRDAAERRVAFEQVIADRAFEPWFQPIVSLSTGETVAFEALTRFASGEPPDSRFRAAWLVGLGAELELAAIAAAVEASHRLPASALLNLNVSPAVLLELGDRLDGLLTACPARAVLEITEHAVVADYSALRDAVGSLASRPLLAVDDAGAGVANFGHIVELRPDFVKIDIGLVRGVDSDPGRQALVVAMVHFAQETGSRVIAEGIETTAEADKLRELGVECGQGYLLGRPAPLPG